MITVGTHLQDKFFS